MNPSEFLYVGLSLQDGPRPGQFRTAVSRAYYAAYHAGVELLESMNIHVSKGSGAHGDLRAKLLNSGEDELVEAGRHLAELHSSRIRADYKLHKKDVENADQVRFLVNRASDLIVTMGRPRSNEARSQIENSIREAEKPYNGRNGSPISSN